jgi:hypothetical protein
MMGCTDHGRTHGCVLDFGWSRIVRAPKVLKVSKMLKMWV